MTTCDRTPICVRVPGHAGVCTACPSVNTLEWDNDREQVAERHIETAMTLHALDFETPRWADLLDD